MDSKDDVSRCIFLFFFLIVSIGKLLLCKSPLFIPPKLLMIFLQSHVLQITLIISTNLNKCKPFRVPNDVNLLQYFFILLYYISSARIILRCERVKHSLVWNNSKKKKMIWNQRKHIDACLVVCTCFTTESQENIIFIYSSMKSASFSSSFSPSYYY